MNFDPIAELNASANQLNPDWLGPLGDTAPLTPVTGTGTSRVRPVAVVRVPDFLNQVPPATDCQHDLSHIQHQAECVVLPRQSSKRPTVAGCSITPTSHLATGKNWLGTEAVTKEITRGSQNQVTGVPHVPQLWSDLIEKPEDWLGGARDIEKEERSKKDASNHQERLDSVATENIDSQSIAELTDQILSRFPLATPTVLLFAGSEWNPHVDETCAQVAYQIASRNVGKVLLVDSEFEKSELTNATRTGSQPGLTEILNRKTDLDSCIADHDEANMDFLPAGVEPVWHWPIVGEKIRVIVRELKSRYQFACVSVGDAHSEAARHWAAEAEGTLLVVSMANSSRAVARSAVDQLHANGARLMGCIVSDAISQ